LTEQQKKDRAADWRREEDTRAENVKYFSKDVVNEIEDYLHDTKSVRELLLCQDDIAEYKMPEDMWNLFSKERRKRHRGKWLAEASKRVLMMKCHQKKAEMTEEHQQHIAKATKLQKDLQEKHRNIVAMKKEEKVEEKEAASQPKPSCYPREAHTASSSSKAGGMPKAGQPKSEGPKTPQKPVEKQKPPQKPVEKQKPIVEKPSIPDPPGKEKEASKETSSLVVPETISLDEDPKEEPNTAKKGAKEEKPEAQKEGQDLVKIKVDAVGKTFHVEVPISHLGLKIGEAWFPLRQRLREGLIAKLFEDLETPTEEFEGSLEDKTQVQDKETDKKERSEEAKPEAEVEDSEPKKTSSGVDLKDL